MSNTGLYVPSFTFYPQKYKSNTLFILFERANKINQNFSDIHKAWVSLSSILISNGHNDSEIKKWYSQSLHTIKSK